MRKQLVQDILVERNKRQLLIERPQKKLLLCLNILFKRLSIFTITLNNYLKSQTL